MNILEILKTAHARLGLKETAKELEIDDWLVRHFVEGKKQPGYKTCQAIIDLWGESKGEQPEGDGSEATFTEEAGITNLGYVPAEWGKKKAKWEGRDVCLCLPAYNDIPQAHFASVLCLVARYRMALQIQFRGEDSMITRSRNQLAKRFLDTGATWSIWFDSDMVFPFGHAGVYGQMTGMKELPEKFLGLHTIERLISHNKTVVGGCYWDRRGSGRIIAGGGGTIMHPIPSDTLHPVGFIGTGCLAVHRQVFLDIAAKFPDTFSDKRLGNECGFFTNIQTPERMMGEDESFGWRATESGHPSYLDLGLCCGHISRGTIHGVPNYGKR